MVRILEILIILVILFIPACAEIDPRTTPEGLLYVQVVTKPPQESTNKDEKPGCWLEFVLINKAGKPVASEGKVTVTISGKGHPDRSHQKEFNIKNTDFRERSLSNVTGITDKPICCRIGPLPNRISPGTVITFEFQRPDGQVFRRRITPSS